MPIIQLGVYMVSGQSRIDGVVQAALEVWNMIKELTIDKLTLDRQAIARTYHHN